MEKDGEDQLDRSCEKWRSVASSQWAIRRRKANWIGHILRRNCLPKQVIEGKIKGEIQVTRRQGRRRKKLLDDLKDRRGYSHLKEEAVDRNMWRDRFGRGFEPVVRQTAGWWWWCHALTITSWQALQICMTCSSQQLVIFNMRPSPWVTDHVQNPCKTTPKSSVT